ncbi:hypothetical protein LCGC14_2510050, partial [marine sediment metagenome]
ALLHDVLEDSTIITTEDIHHSFGEGVLNTVLTLTRIKNEDYFDYIARINVDADANADAVKVKLADLRDNMNVLRLRHITDKDIARLNKYAAAYKLLNA